MEQDVMSRLLGPETPTAYSFQLAEAKLVPGSTQTNNVNTVSKEALSCPCCSPTPYFPSCLGDSDRELPVCGLLELTLVHGPCTLAKTQRKTVLSPPPPCSCTLD